MFDAIFNRTDANISTFSVAAGNLSKGTSPLTSWFNDKSILVPMNARSSFMLAEEHQMFDQIILLIMQKGIGIKYVESLHGFMDPKARFKEFLEGKLTPASVGLELTHEELALASTYKSVRAKFDAMFTLPTPPMSPGIDLTQFFRADQIAEIEAWRDSDDIHKRLSAEIQAVIARCGPRVSGLLRLVKTSASTYVIQNYLGNCVSRTNFTQVSKVVLEKWNQNRTGFVSHITGKQRGSRYTDTYRVEVADTYVEIGCNYIPRAEVEAMAAKLSVLFPDNK